MARKPYLLKVTCQYEVANRAALNRANQRECSLPWWANISLASW